MEKINLEKKTRKRIPKRIIISVAILTVILALAVTWAALTDVIILRKTEDMAGSENAISILFVGNSQVFIGELPRQLKTIAGMYGIEIVYKDISRHGNRGGSLNELKEKAINEIQSRRFDYVVLHDDARQPNNNIEEFLSDVQFLCDEARENDVMPVLYNAAVWNNNGQPDEKRQSVSTEAYKRAAIENDVILLNAGDAWAYAYQTIPGISLYTRFDPRGPHANNAGGFFTACVVAAVLFDLHIEEIPKNNLYKGSDAIELAQTAWNFVQLSLNK